MVEYPKDRDRIIEEKQHNKEIRRRSREKRLAINRIYAKERLEIIERWIGQLIADPLASETSKDLYESYCNFARLSAHSPMSHVEFGEWVGERIVKNRHNNKTTYVGYWIPTSMKQAPNRTIFDEWFATLLINGSDPNEDGYKVHHHDMYVNCSEYAKARHQPLAKVRFNELMKEKEVPRAKFRGEWNYLGYGLPTKAARG